MRNQFAIWDKFFRRGSLYIAVGVLLAMPGYGANLIIDHTNWDWYNGQIQTIADTVATQKIFFAHASVGGNVLNGLADLHSSNAVKYPLGQSGVSTTPPATTSNGMIYEYNRGNPDWSVKVSDFETYIGNGWHAPKVDLVINKFCFIDQNANWGTYRDSLLALEAANPSTRFVYWTMPIKTDTNSDQVLRAQFNTNLRNWIATQNNKILFDIADIEAWSPTGSEQTFISGMEHYQCMYFGYSSDGGHLNQTGYDRVATGLYSLIGQAVSGSAGVNPTVTPHTNPTASVIQAYPNPASDEVMFEIKPTCTGKIEVLVFNLGGERIGFENAYASVVGQSVVVKWACQASAQGLYLVQIRLAGDLVKNIKLAIKH